MNDNFNLFLNSVEKQHQDFVRELHDLLTKDQCKCEIKPAKSGYLVSYVFLNTKKTLANFVFRKSGIKLRIYADHIEQYQEFLNTLPMNCASDWLIRMTAILSVQWGIHSHSMMSNTKSAVSWPLCQH